METINQCTYDILSNVLPELEHIREQNAIRCKNTNYWNHVVFTNDGEEEDWTFKMGDEYFCIRWHGLDEYEVFCSSTENDDDACNFINAHIRLYNQFISDLYQVFEKHGFDVDHEHEEYDIRFSVSRDNCLANVHYCFGFELDEVEYCDDYRFMKMKEEQEERKRQYEAMKKPEWNLSQIEVETP